MRFYNTKLDFPDDFFEPEVRCGYEVSEKNKKVWAILLDLVVELERVCKKYNITMYADAGTLLGTVRHQGFIPWDDDIDIALKRKDYEKLCKVASKEFKHPYFFQTAYTDDHCFRGHAQLRNTETTGIVFLDHGMPYNKGIFIDIFPLDKVPDSKIERKIMRFRAQVIWLFLSTSYYNPNNMRPYAKIICKIMKPFYKIVDYRKVYRHYEKVCSRYNKKHTKKMAWYAWRQCLEADFLKVKDYDGQIERMPFEFIDLPVPKGYDSVLKDLYQDYMTPVQASPVGHGIMITEPEIPYYKYEKNEGNKLKN